MLSKIIVIVCPLFGLYLLYISILSFKNNKINISGEIISGKEAKKYSILVTFIALMLIILPIITIIFVGF